MSADDTDDNEIFAIKNLDAFCDTMISAVKSIYGEEVGDKVQPWEVKNLLREHSLGCNDEGDFVINQQVLTNLQEALFSIHFGLLLSQMAAEGDLECSWDAETGEPVFCKSDATRNSSKEGAS